MDLVDLAWQSLSGDSRRVPPALPRGARAPRTRNDALLAYYEDECLGLVAGAEESLDRVLAREDAELADVRTVLLRGGHPDLVASYTHPLAFMGGAGPLLLQVEAATALVVRAAQETGADVPPIYCALWPGPELNARSILRPEGGLILLNTGLVIATRLLLQEAMRYPATIFGDPAFGNDLTILETARDTVGTLIGNCLGGRDLRDGVPTRVTGGLVEYSRRAATLAALCFLIAHEVGHLSRAHPAGAGTWQPKADLGSTDKWTVRRPGPHEIKPVDDREEGGAYFVESTADQIAVHVCRAAPISREGYPSPPVIVGAMSALALQAALWWRAAAFGDSALGWTHPCPESRVQMVGESLRLEPYEWHDLVESPKFRGPDLSPPMTSQLFAVMGFTRWMEFVTGMDLHRSAALERGLGDRAMNTAGHFMLLLAENLKWAKWSDEPAR